MAYSENLVVNGNASAGAGSWLTSNVLVSTYGGSAAFKLTGNASMSQDIAQVQFVTVPKHFKIACRYEVTPDIDDLDVESYALLRFTLYYFDGTASSFTRPLLEALETRDASGNFNLLEIDCPVRNDAVLTKINVTALTYGLQQVLYIDDISVQRFMDDLELHMVDPNPHDLPLAITVGQFGIKAMKGAVVEFWLKDDGSAEFAGELKAATGTFAGTLSVGTIGAMDLTNNAVFSTYAGTVDEHALTLNDPTTGVVTRLASAESSIVQNATDIELKGSASDYNGDSIISKINVSTGLIDISADKLNLNGAVNFYSLDSSLQTDVNAGTAANGKIQNWSYDSTYIDGAKIFTGSITANQIDTTGLSAERIEAHDYPDNYIEVGGSGSWFDTTFYKGTSPVLRLYDSGVGIEFHSYGVPFLIYNDISKSVWLKDAQVVAVFG